MSWIMLAVAFTCWAFTIALGAKIGGRDSIISSFLVSSSAESLSAMSYYGGDCTGHIEVSIFLTGTQVVVDPGSTTGPPNCNSRDTDLGPGYTFSQTTSALYEEYGMLYGINSNYHEPDFDSTIHFGLTSIGTNLAQHAGRTIACLSTVNTVINSYDLISSYDSSGHCIKTAKRVPLNTPILLEKGTPIYAVFFNISLVSSILSQVNVTTCDKAKTFNPYTGCWSSSWTGVDLQEVWMGVPLTYDASQVMTQPSCAKPLESLGAGYTGSSTYTTVTLRNIAGSVEVDTESNAFLGIFREPSQRLFNGNGITAIDGQMIGCWTSLYYLAQGCEIITQFFSCRESSSVTNLIHLNSPVTDSAQQPFITTESGQVLLAPQLRSQIAASISLTATVTSVVAPVATASALSSSVLAPLHNSDLGLSGATKTILICAVAAAIALIFSFVAFFIWRRYYTRQYQKSDAKLVSLASNDAQHESWRAPLIMLAGFVSGLALALGHHFFYTWVNRHLVDDVNISQSWILRLGNLLAFAVKLSLSISIGVAFVQLQWVRLRQERRELLRMKDIDTLSGILANVLSFADGLVWHRYPSLLLIAVFYWLLPIVPVITPGTITVIPVACENLTQLRVPQLNINSSTWTEVYDVRIINSYRGTTTLSKIVTASANLGEILPIQFDYTNTTYHLDFFGPAVQCHTADPNLNISNTLGRFGSLGQYNSYYAWRGGEDIWNPTFTHCGGDINNLDLTSLDRARLYIMTNTNRITLDYLAGDLEKGDNTSVSVNLTECSLYNATYSVDLSFIGTQQAVNVQNITYLHGVSFPPLYPYLSDTHYTDQTMAYAGLMAAFGSLLVGSIEVDFLNNSQRNCTSIGYIDTGIDFNNPYIVTGTDPLSEFQSRIEELFRNITISLMNNNAFLKNASTADLVPVNITTILTTYSYNSFDLILTYTIGLLTTLICCLAGFYNFWLNGGSYQNIFSTFIRATKYSELTIEDEDTGADPCPRTLGQASVKFTSNTTTGYSRSPPNSPRQHLIARKPLPGSRKVSHGQDNVENEDQQVDVRTKGISNAL